MQLISISSVCHRQSIKPPVRWCNVTQCSPAATRFFIFHGDPVSCILQAGQTRLKSHLSALTTQPAWRHVTGSQQEEVIERVTEEESCRQRGRRRRKEWQRGLAGEETAEWMSMYSFIDIIEKGVRLENGSEKKKQKGKAPVRCFFFLKEIAPV